MIAPKIASYRNGGYRVSIHEDGTKVRRRIASGLPPEHPEQLDLKITDWCDAGCFWCHEMSTKRGAHGDVDAMLDLLSGLPAGVEIAIGGGDPLSHPDFPRLARGLRDAGLLPSVTVNGRHLERSLPALKELAAEKAVYGVGVSFFQSLPEWDYPHKVVHMIAGVDDPSVLDGAPRQKVLVLGYKDFGRGEKHRSKRPAEVAEGIARWRRELLWLAREHHVSFDTLAIEQLEPSRLFLSGREYSRRFMGKEGEFSMYVDGVRQEFAVSSYSSARQPWSDIQSMFASVRMMAGLPGCASASGVGLRP